MSKKEEKTKKSEKRKTVSKKNSVTGYDAKDIQVLEGLDPVRKRPGMYIGSTGPDGLHHLVWEVVDNSIDEAMAGHADHIKIELLPEDKVRVSDNGRGIPVEKHEQTKKSALETVMTTLHAGGKFGGEGYKVSGGLHGVGVSVVNALSIWTQAEVYRNGSIYTQEYKYGKPKYAVKKTGSYEKNGLSLPGQTGTVITFKPDLEIFKSISFDFKRLLNRFRQQAYLTKGVRIEFEDKRQVPSTPYGFYFEGGLYSYLDYLVGDFDRIISNDFYVQREVEGVNVEIAFTYIDDIDKEEMSFVNNVYTLDGGMHVTGFRSAMTRTLNDFARKEGYLKASEENLTGDDVREGLVTIITVKLREPQFEGQTKGRLGSPEARTAVESVMNEAFSEYLERYQSDARKIMEKNLLAAKARRAAKAAKYTVIRKGVLDGLSLPGKLADCTSKDPTDSELFIVEGDSAGGSAKSARDRRTQAILPLRGKILNVEKARIDKMLANKEIKALVIALGTAIAESFDIGGLRYDKIIIATDADVDGAHIRTLLLTLFYRYFPEIVEKGHIYIAKPPLYMIKRGKEIHYAYTEKEKNEITKNFKSGFGVQRYKGLGEMNPEQLWETTMNPENRVLKRVTVDDASEADKMFDTLMGKEVAPRKMFIQAHAKAVSNLDI